MKQDLHNKLIELENALRNDDIPSAQQLIYDIQFLLNAYRQQRLVVETDDCGRVRRREPLPF